MKNIKKVVLTSAMGLLFFVGLTSMISMDPPYNAANCTTDCSAFVEAGIFSSHGVCMSACNTCTNPSSSAATVGVCICTQLNDGPGFELFGFNNMGDCVTTLKALFSGI